MQINGLTWVSSHLFFVYLQRTRCVLYKRTKSKAIAHSLPLESGKFKLTVDDEHNAQVIDILPSSGVIISSAWAMLSYMVRQSRAEVA